MFGGFFGEYLLRVGAISSDELDKAVKAQRVNNVLLGALAIQKGYITEKQLTEVLEVQIREHKIFGQIAIEKDLMTEENVQELLKIQAQNHICLGESLVRKGILDESQLIYYLRIFDEEMKIGKEELRWSIERLPNKDLLYLALEMSRSFFFRFGYVVKIDDVGLGLPADNTQFTFFLGEQHFEGNRKTYFGYAFPDSVMLLIMQKLPWFDEIDSSSFKSETHEYLAQIVFNLNYSICHESRSINSKAKHGSVISIIPNNLPLLSFRLIGMVDPFYALYITSQN